jgi:hypothetical protein
VQAVINKDKAKVGDEVYPLIGFYDSNGVIQTKFKYPRDYIATVKIIDGVAVVCQPLRVFETKGGTAKTYEK